MRRPNVNVPGLGGLFEEECEHDWGPWVPSVFGGHVRFCQTCRLGEGKQAKEEQPREPREPRE